VKPQPHIVQDLRLLTPAHYGSSGSVSRFKIPKLPISARSLVERPSQRAGQNPAQNSVKPSELNQIQALRGLTGLGVWQRIPALALSPSRFSFEGQTALRWIQLHTKSTGTQQRGVGVRWSAVKSLERTRRTTLGASETALLAKCDPSVRSLATNRCASVIRISVRIDSPLSTSDP
jgi:hypothetical protein